jgi:predicted molibdopterin-dependent oxidoreductase YjgC
MTFHFPESRTNLLIGNAVDEFTGCPEYKVCAVKLMKIGDGDRGKGQESVAAG